MADFLFLSGQESGEADTKFCGSHFRKTKGSAGSSGVSHAKGTFLSSEVIDRASHVAIPVNTIQSKVEMSIKQQHGNSPEKSKEAGWLADSGEVIVEAYNMRKRLR
jgi:hypothetical protein